MGIEKRKALGESVVRVAFSHVPYLGSALSESIFDHRSRIKQARIEEFINGFAEFINEFDSKPKAEAIRRIETEEFSDVFEQILKQIASKDMKSKKAIFRQVLYNEIFMPSYSEFTDSFIEHLGKITITQIRILAGHKKLLDGIRQTSRDEIIQQLRNQYRVLEEYRRVPIAEPTVIEVHEKHLERLQGELRNVKKQISNLQYLRNFDEYTKLKGEYDFYVQDLQSKSLLRDNGIGAMDYEPYSIMEITEYGEAFLDFITDESGVYEDLK